MIRVLVTDDQALVRDGLRLILDSQPDIEVVGEASDGEQAVRETLLTGPDVVLMDIRMAGVDGLEATRRVVARANKATRVLVLTTFDLDEYVYQALEAGASGFLLKSSPRQHLLHAVRTVADGGALLDPSLTRRLVEQHVRGPAARPAGLDGALARLTARERDVLDQLARGRSNAEIATDLHLGETTVKTHVAHVLRKLDLRDRVQAVVFGYEAGLVTPGTIHQDPNAAPR